ncbi:MAG: NAD-dependent epimerase/dehydratase family protein [Bdellovibrionales bacterium]|nr:NAD-dependent epimerase/dehydratase family protein [Bdellovibrionales bacterium]
MTLDNIKSYLSKDKKKWLLTGCAGFVGSHILETLLEAGQTVVGVDNLTTGSEENLEAAKTAVGNEAFQNFTFAKLDIQKLGGFELFSGIDFVIHQAAMASVPQSMQAPMQAFDNNVLGTEVVFDQARKAGVKKVVFASSSAVYGDNADEVKSEIEIGAPLSPYGNSKLINEKQAQQLSQVFGIPTVGLRYFNVFGVRQSPEGPYAAVIPAWLEALQGEQAVKVFGDGQQTRDFVHVKDVVKANLLATNFEQSPNSSLVLNVAGGVATSLLDLHQAMAKSLQKVYPSKKVVDPLFLPEREGDIKHSLGSIKALKEQLDFHPDVSLELGLQQMFESQ